MKKNFKVAFIGAGYMAEEHIKAYKSIEKFDCVAIFSRNKTKALNLSVKYSIPNVFDSISSLYENTHADIVLICVNELSTFNVLLEAFKYSWVCLIEKPVGINFEQQKSILVQASNFNAKAYIALNRRHYSSTRYVVNALEDKIDQRIVTIFDQENPTQALKSGRPELVCKNWMFANSVHLIDYFNIFCRGKLLNIENILKREKEIDFFMLSKLTFSSGDIGIYNAIWDSPGPWSVTINTKNIRWEMRPLETVTYLDFNSRQSVSLSIDQYDIDFKPGLKYQALESLKLLNGEENNLPSIFEGFKATEIINQIYNN
jgi:hypothetical protein